jgi:hypothetical protein
MSSWVTKWWKQDKKKNSKTKASSYWYDDYSSDFDYSSFYKGAGYDTASIKSMQRSADLYKLNATRRAISNFVNIVTGKNIPVKFAARSSSHTDGESVVLSADINDHFDVGVGLALHEGSHIVLSDFNLLRSLDEMRTAYLSVMADTTKSMSDKFDTIRNYINSHADSKYVNLFHSIFTDTGLAKYRDIDRNLIQVIHGITNWIEDRRIDSYIYKNAPGYRQYYLQMYDHYFNSKDVTKGIESDEYRTEDIDSYMFRIINFTNEKTDLNALKQLRRIYGMIDLKRISRLNTTVECMQLSVDVVNVILEQIGKDTDLAQKGQGQGDGEGDGNGPGEITITDVSDKQSDEQGGMSMGGSMSGEATMSTNPSDKAGSGTGDTKITMTKTALEKLRKAFEKQKKFLADDIKKKNLTKDEQKSLSNIEESGSELRNVGGDVAQTYYGGIGKGDIGKGVDCVVVKRVTEATAQSDEFPFRWSENSYMEEVQDGIKLGTILGNKLQVRSESRDTVYNRLNKGKIDQRLISGLGYGAESVFYTKEVDQYNKVNLHISVDYSGSMSGSRHRNVVRTVVAIAKAAQLARNIDVQVSIRSTNRSTHTASLLPYIAMVYDSRTDKFNHLVKMMASLSTGNTTPEGLCFEAIAKYLVPTTKDRESYFLNMSDGEPGFQGNSFVYQGEPAATHTFKQVKRMMDNGINVMSYFINEAADTNSRSWKIFRQSYGDAAKMVDTKNLTQLARTMNELFLKKGNRE